MPEIYSYESDAEFRIYFQVLTASANRLALFNTEKTDRFIFKLQKQHKSNTENIRFSRTRGVT